MSYIFVGGSQRSGTTLLAQSMCSGEETNPYFGESSSLRGLMQLYKHMSERFDEESVFHFTTREKMDEYFARCLKGFLDQTLTTQAPATSLVMKEPHLTMYFPLIQKLIPNALFVVIVRDPRDVVCSMLKVGKKIKERGEKHPFAALNVKLFAQTIGEFYRPVLTQARDDQAFAKQVQWIRYEDLISEPEQIIERIRAFTGLKIELFDPENPMKRILHEKEKDSEGSKRKEPWLTDLMLGGSIAKTNHSKYKHDLSSSEIRQIQEILPGLISSFGYELH